MLGFAPLASIPLASTFNLGMTAEISPGRPMRFTCVVESFEFRADGAEFKFTTIAEPFVFRGVPE